MKAALFLTDPFGGSGVTAIEALMNKRKAVNIDLNPMDIFIARALLAPVNFSELSTAFDKVKKEYLKNEPNNKAEIEKILETYKGPKNLSLPKGSDVETVIELFTQKQLAQLSLLKGILLMFSGLITKKNLAYHTSTIVTADGGGDASAMRYYRYRIAPDLSFLPKESVDYIYTDPPYGKKIPSLDLSVMWNARLDLEVSEDDYKMEAIEGGEHHNTKENYNYLMAKSIKEMYRVLKFYRRLSFAFAHKDPEFWRLIIEICEKCGFEYIGAVPQKNGQTSFKKRQRPFTILSGQLIINFRKVHNPRAVLKANSGMDMGEAVIQTIEGIIAKNNGASLEQINDELITRVLELGFLDLLKKEYTDLTPLLLEHFDYDSSTETYTIKRNTKFQTHIDTRLRIRYYFISYLRRMERQNITPSFNDIVYDIMPLLKNGITPEHQTILTVLEDLAEKTGENAWHLKQAKSPRLNLPW
jgi:16S rRNA G966 N2-methylase RsmD